MKPLHRVAILNRGEAAVRCLRTLRPYARARDLDLVAVAFFTAPDAGAPFVRLADEAVDLGPAHRVDAAGRAVAAYCDHDWVLGHLRAARVDAVWPGWGFVAEDAEFVARLEAAGITFVGPDAATMRALGDKIAAKRLAEAAAVPLAPWRALDDADPASWADAAAAVGYPLMVKAAAGGGGRGIRRVESPAALPAALDAVRAEVARSFGGGGVLLEACVDAARHVEVQLLGTTDAAGAPVVQALGVRDCTLQRRHQKVIEETPSPVLPAENAASLQAAAVRLAASVGYRGAGTAEFLYDPATGRTSFLEVNARLQVEHTVTELVWGCDLVEAQLDVARGLPWAPPAAGPRGHAIEVRLNAEEPADGFAPRPGRVRVFAAPQGPGVRVDTGVEAGQVIAPQFDSMIAKVMAWGADRAQARARLRAALAEMDVLVEDGATNKAFLGRLLDHPAFVASTAHTTWLDAAPADLLAPAHARAALLAAAILEARRARAADVGAFFAAAQDGIPTRLPAPEGRVVELRVGGARHTLVVCERPDDAYAVTLDGRIHRARFVPRGAGAATLHLDGRAHRVLFAAGEHALALAVDGATHTIARAAGGVVRAPAPAIVVDVAVAPGDRVEVGDVVCTLEAMKMETTLHATEAGVVGAVLCRPNEQVVGGQALLRVAPSREERAAVAATAEAVMPDPAAAAEVVRALALGFDVAPAGADAAIAALSAAADDDDPEALAAWAPLASLLPVLADAEALFDRGLLPLRDARTAASPELLFYAWLRGRAAGDAPDAALDADLRRALAHAEVALDGPDDAVRAACFRLAAGHAHGGRRLRACSALLRLAMRAHGAGPTVGGAALRDALDRLARLDEPRHRSVADNARQARYVIFEQPRFEQRRRLVGHMLDALLDGADLRDAAARRRCVEVLAASPHSLASLLLARARDDAAGVLAAEVVLRRLYAGRELAAVEVGREGGLPVLTCLTAGGVVAVRAVLATPDAIGRALAVATARPARGAVEILLGGGVVPQDPTVGLDAAPDRPVTLTWADGGAALRHHTLDPAGDPAALRGLHPEAARRIEVERLSAFELTRLDAPDDLFAFLGRARSNPADARVFVTADVREGPAGVADPARPWWALERAFHEAVGVVRAAQAERGARDRLHGNRVYVAVRPVLDLDCAAVAAYAHRLEGATRGLGLDKVILRVRVRDAAAVGGVRATAFEVARPGGHRLEVREVVLSDRPVRARGAYRMKVAAARRLGTVYPYEVLRMLVGDGADALTPHPDLGRGAFVEHDLDASGLRLEPVDRPAGENVAGVVVGVLTNLTAKHPRGVRRVWIASDPTRGMGALAEPECRRIVAAIDLAAELGLPVEWLAVSAGARIAMDSGTENLDWTARVLRRLVEHTQAGGEVNVVVHGPNVGAQAYWDAEAAILLHTRGVLVMTPAGSMVLTGAKALAWSGGVAARDERGIGGFERVMGPNGQAQLLARDLGDAFALLMEHYRFTWRAPGARRPAPHPTLDPSERSILAAPYVAERGEPFRTVGDLFDPALNPGRKQPFDVRQLMAAVVDADGGHLERWRAWRGAETAVVWDAHLGGHAVCLIGIESQPQPRHGWVPLDGPGAWSGGTLFPQSARKIARALNAASGNRPAVVLANLSGFDGSPESMRRLQLEHGGELGRAVVNFRGPLVFLVVGRYHGGAYVVFSKALNPGLRALAVEGSFASVIGGAPAAAVVFAREVRARVEADARFLALRADLAAASAIERPRLREAVDALRATLTLEHRGAVAAAFDAVHTVERAVEVGSLDAVIAPAAIRPTLIAEVGRARG